MTDDKKRPEYPGPGPYHPRCYCTIYGLDAVTVAQMKAIAKEIDRMMLEPPKEIDPGNMIHYYHKLEGHFERRH